jgi:glutamate:GABA antiporter
MDLRDARPDQARKVKQESTQLVRELKLRDLVLFNLVAVLGLRHLATSAKFGPSSLIIWGLAAVFFFVPQGLAVIELSSRFPKEGGIYFWTRSTLGEGHGFLCGWCYWICNVLYYPNLLISTAVIATYVIGKGDSTLKDDWTYVLISTLFALWAAVVLNLVGLGTGKWLQNAGGLGMYTPGLVLIALGIYGVFAFHGANAINLETLKPDLTDLPSLNLLATIAFAFAGLELASTMGDEIDRPERNLPRSVYISAPLIAIAYILGTAAVLWLVPGVEINLVAGFLQAISNGANHFSGWLFWLAPLCAGLYTIGSIGGVGAWLAGPARIAFAIGLDRYFPPAFGRIHPRWHTPYVAILVQASLATVFLLVSVLGRGTTVQNVYLVLLDTQLLIYFIPYLYLFVVFLLQRFKSQGPQGAVKAPGGPIGAYFVGLSGLFVTLFAMVVSTIPPPDTAEPLYFRLKVIGGALAFVVFGGLIYWRARWRRL